MRAKLTPEIVENEDIQEIEAGKPLLQTEELAIQFADFGAKIEAYKKFATGLKIADDDNLMVAENTSSEILEVAKNVEKTRKLFKEPYFQTGKLIDDYAKTISDPLTTTRATINAEIANYKKVQAAFAKEKADNELKKLQVIEAAKLEEIERISRIEVQLNARLYGGMWTNKSGMPQTSAGCITVAHCDELLALIEKKVPKADTYTYYGDRHDIMIKEMKRKLASHKINVFNANSDTSSKRLEAQEKISIAKVEANVKSAETKESGEKLVAKEVNKEAKNITTEVQTVRKGLKRVLKFAIMDPTIVPKDFWIIDEDKIKYWMTQHSEEIKENLTKNIDSLAGIKFFIDETYSTQ